MSYTRNTGLLPASKGRGTGFAGPQAQRLLGSSVIHEVTSVGYQ